MAIPARLARTLHDALGEEGADDLVNWMVLVDSRRSELQDVVEAWKVSTDAQFAAFEARIDARFAASEARIDARFAAADARMENRFLEQQRWMEARFADLEIRFERRFGDLLKWSFVFWCGAVGAVAMLARAFGRQT